MKITMRDKVILVIVAAGICAWGEYKMMFTPMQEKIISLQQETEAVKGLLTDITPLLEESEKLSKKENQLKKRIETIKASDHGRTVTNEEFLVFLGNSTAKNNVNVTGFNNLGLTVENDVYKMHIDMELKGSGNDINNVLTDIEKMGVKYSVGSVSYRQNEQYDYLKRFYDDLTDLPWYEDPDEEEIEEFNKQNNQEQSEDFAIEDNFDINTYYPEIDISPDIAVPEPSEPQESTTSEEAAETPKSIDERIDQLLKLMAFSPGNIGYEIELLTNNNYEYKEGQDMRLAITLCIIMFDEPIPGNILLYETENGENGVL